MKNPTYQIVQRLHTKRVDIMRKILANEQEWHHVATCESLETARTLVRLMNEGLEATMTEVPPKPKRKR